MLNEFFVRVSKEYILISARFLSALLFFLIVVRFIFELGCFTTISWSRGRVVSCSAVAPIMSLGVFSGAASLRIKILVSCSVWLFSLWGVRKTDFTTISLTHSERICVKIYIKFPFLNISKSNLKNKASLFQLNN